MPISRKPRSQVVEQDTPFEMPTAQLFEDVDHENTGGVDPQKSETEERIEKMAQQLADMQQQLMETQRANMALLSNPAAKNDTFVPQYEDPEKIPLPDAALDPQGFEAAITKRTEIRQRNHEAKLEAERRRGEHTRDRTESLEAEFADKYPDYVLDKEKLEFATVSVAKAAAKRGVDVERYMFLTPDRFMGDVVAKYDKLFGSPNDNEGDDDDYDEDYPARGRASSRAGNRSKPRRRNRQEDDDMVSRTAGVFGGAESGGRPTKGRDVDTGPDMIDDLHAIQRKTGFF